MRSTRKLGDKSGDKPGDESGPDSDPKLGAAESEMLVAEKLVADCYHLGDYPSIPAPSATYALWGGTCKMNSRSCSDRTPKSMRQADSFSASAGTRRAHQDQGPQDHQAQIQNPHRRTYARHPHARWVTAPDSHSSRHNSGWIRIGVSPKRRHQSTGKGGFPCPHLTLE